MLSFPFLNQHSEWWVGSLATCKGDLWGGFFFSWYNYKLTNFNIFDESQSIEDAQIIPSLNAESLFNLTGSWHESFGYNPVISKGFPSGSAVKHLSAMQETQGSMPGFGKTPWKRKWQPTPVFLPGESHRGRSLPCHGVQRVGHDWETEEQQTVISESLLAF